MPLNDPNPRPANSGPIRPITAVRADRTRQVSRDEPAMPAVKRQPPPDASTRIARAATPTDPSDPAGVADPMSPGRVDELSAGRSGITGSVSSARPGWLSGILLGQARRIVTHLFFSMAIGGSMGLMGSALAAISQHPHWDDILSGALGASGALGFEFLTRWTAPLQSS